MTSRIYTRSGDQGETSLANGARVSKDSARVEAYGAVDEAVAWVGLARTRLEGEPLLDPMLAFLQHRLMNAASNLALPPGGKTAPPTVTEDDVTFLERAIDRLEAATGKLTVFVLPGGSPVAGLLHVARTVCRRAERRIVTLRMSEPVDPASGKFVNRASDFLFAAARYANHQAGTGDVVWDKDFPEPAL